MKSKDAIVKEKEREEKMKALRKELEAELEEQLAGEADAGQSTVESHKVDTNQPLEPAEAEKVIEALIFASSKPITVAEIRKAVKGFTAGQIEAMIENIKVSFEKDGRGFEVVEVAGGYEIATLKKFAPWILKIELQKKARQATQSALETMAILAYKQPITRAEIEELRGVDVSGVMNTLMEKGFIKIVGKKEVPGRPFLYGTTDKFLEHFGLKELKDLPNIEEIKTIVESSVKREELLGRPQIVDVPAETGEENAGQPQADENQESNEPEIKKENDSGTPSASQEN